VGLRWEYVDLKWRRPARSQSQTWDTPTTRWPTEYLCIIGGGSFILARQHNHRLQCTFKKARRVPEA